MTKTIEQGSHGATYQNDSDTFTVYELSRYPRSSVLAGQQRRVWLDDYPSLAEAQAAHPDAVVTACSSYRPPSLNHLDNGGDE
jgi:gluconate kinase